MKINGIKNLRELFTLNDWLNRDDIKTDRIKILFSLACLPIEDVLFKFILKNQELIKENFPEECKIFFENESDFLMCVRNDLDLFERLINLLIDKYGSLVEMIMHIPFDQRYSISVNTNININTADDTIQFVHPVTLSVIRNTVIIEGIKITATFDDSMNELIRSWSKAMIDLIDKKDKDD